MMRVVALSLIAAGAAWCVAPVKQPETVVFEPNRGQAPEEYDFLSHGSGYAVGLQPGCASLVSSNARLSTVLVGARRSARGVGESPLAGQVNYLRGGKSNWITGIPTYSRVRYRGVYPGIDLVYYGNAGALEYDFVVAPGSDPRAIRMQYEGARKLRIDGGGDLIVETAGGDLRQHRPVVYQEIAGVRHEIGGRYVLRGPTVSFELAAYDRKHQLVIDPVLTWSTFIAYTGSFGGSLGESVTVDSVGNVYMIGTTVDIYGYYEAILSKLSPSGSNILTTFFSFQTGYNNYGHAIAVDGTGNVYFAGEITDGATFEYAWIGEINSALTASYFQGLPDFNGTTQMGNGLDAAYGVALDGANPPNMYIVGYTTSTNFPITAGSAQARNQGGNGDAFVVKYSTGSSGGKLLAGTYLGGSGADFGYAIAVDTAGDAFITGQTASTNFPTTSGSLQTTYGGSADAFVTKLSPTLGMVFSTYLGGNQSDSGNGIAVDPSGAIYVVGETASTNFPLQNPMQKSYGGGNGDMFLAKLNGNGQTLAYSTYIGGSLEDSGNGVALDSSGNVYVAGATLSTDFPIANAFQSTNQNTAGGNGIVFGVDPTGSSLLFSSYLGGNGAAGASAGGAGGDLVSAIAANCAVGLVVTGTTTSANFPVTTGAFIGTYPGYTGNAFLTNIGAGPETPAISTGGVLSSWNPVAVATPVAPGSLLSIYGTGLASTTTIATTLPLATNAGGTTVTINGILAPILYASPTQLNVQVPYEIPVGTAQVAVQNGCGKSAPASIQVASAYPYILQSGTGDAVSFNQDNSVNSASNPAAGGSVLTVYVTGIGPLDNPVATGAGASASPLSRPTLPTSATIGGFKTDIYFIGLTPGTAGVAQADLIVPTGLSPGTYSVVLTVNGVASNGPNVYKK